MVEDPATRLKPIIETPATLVPGRRGELHGARGHGQADDLYGRGRRRGPPRHHALPDPRSLGRVLQEGGQRPLGLGPLPIRGGRLLGQARDSARGRRLRRRAGRRQPQAQPLPRRRLLLPAARAQGRARPRSESFKLGTYIGALRFMVVAGRAAPSRAGRASAARPSARPRTSVPVRADLMAQLTAPRVLSPGEEASIPATVFAFMGAKKATVTLKAGGRPLARRRGHARPSTSSRTATCRPCSASRRAHRPGHGQASGSSRRSRARRAEQTIDLEVQVGGRARHERDRRRRRRPARPGRPTSTCPGEPGTNSISVELSRLKPIDLAERVDWLIQYPHGCAEQTTSAAFPQLYLPKAVSLSAPTRRRPPATTSPPR